MVNNCIKTSSSLVGILAKMSDQKGRGRSTASKDAGVTSTRPIGSADPAKQVPLPGSSGTSLASQVAAKSPPPPTPGALIGAGGPPSFPFNPAQAYQQAQMIVRCPNRRRWMLLHPRVQVSPTSNLPSPWAATRLPVDNFHLSLPPPRVNGSALLLAAMKEIRC